MSLLNFSQSLLWNHCTQLSWYSAPLVNIFLLFRGSFPRILCHWQTGWGDRVGVKWHVAAYLAKLSTDFDEIFRRCGALPEDQMIRIWWRITIQIQVSGFLVIIRSWGQKVNCTVGVSLYSCEWQSSGRLFLAILTFIYDFTIDA